MRKKPRKPNCNGFDLTDDFNEFSNPKLKKIKSVEVTSQLLKPKDVCEMLNISHQTLYLWSLIDSHPLRFMRLSPRVRRYLREDVENFINLSQMKGI